MREYAAERRRLRLQVELDERRRAKRLGEIDRAIRRMIDMIEKGEGGVEIARRVRELELERDGLRLEAACREPDVVGPHPAVAERYRARPAAAARRAER